MKNGHMPRVDGRYWAAIAMASLFGTNLGDLYAHHSGLGLIGGVPVLAALALLVFLIERRDRSPRELYYWLVIIIIRTGATNIADYYKHLIAWPLFALLLTALLLLFARASLRAGRAGDGAGDMPPTGAAYWAAMLAAGVFGTFIGDVSQKLVGRDLASLGLGLLLVAALLLWHRLGAARAWCYWLVVAVARTNGTAMGDWLAERDRLGIGLPLATLVTGSAFVAILLFWPRRRPAPAPAAGG